MLAFAVALSLAQPAPDQAIQEALLRMARCNGTETGRLARAGTDAPEAIVTAAFAACAEREREVERLLVAAVGAADAQALMADLRDHARQRMLQGVAEARGTARANSDGDEALAWGGCVRREAAARAAGPDAVEAIIAAARQACLADEQATRAAMTRKYGAENADRTVAGLLISLESTVRETVANARAPAR